MKKQILTLLFAIGAVVTYGHAYHHQLPYTVQFDGSRVEADAFYKCFVAITSAALWPLYWSQYLWGEATVSDGMQATPTAGHSVKGGA